MSGPIIRKYGFPNFDKIFGKKDMQHGSESADAPSAEAQIAEAAGAAPPSQSQSSSGEKPSGSSEPSNPADARR